MTNGDKAECKEIARVIMKEVMEEHIASCPHGKIITNAKWLIIGMFGANVAGGGMIAFIIHLVSGTG